MSDIEEFLDHNPLSEMDALGLLPDGDYKAYIKKVEIKTTGSFSKNPGKKYFMATLDVYGENNRVHTLFANCVLDYMLKHMYDASGKTEKYNEKKLSVNDCVDSMVTVKVKIREGNEKYPKPKNEIWDFLPCKDEDLNDQLPF